MQELNLKGSTNMHTFRLLFGLSVLMAFNMPIQAQLKLNGAGATFPYVIYSKWFDVYHIKTDIQFNYQSIGSGGGIKQVIEGTVDFGASDGPMSDDQLKEAKTKQGVDVLHIPTVMGAVVVTYNVEEIGKDLRLTPNVLAAIFMGEITMWNDTRISSINPGKTFPHESIIVAHRSDGSGTTYIFTDYLSKVSESWNSRAGRGTSVKWPVGLGGKGDEGVSGLVKQTPGSIGYVELAYATQNRMAMAALRNREGHFVLPSLESTSEAAAGAAKTMPADFRVSLVDAPGKDSYPVCGLTWLLVYRDQRDEAKGKALVSFLAWAMHDGQKRNAPLLYAPIPGAVVEKVDIALKQIRYKGKSLY